MTATRVLIGTASGKARLWECRTARPVGLPMSLQAAICAASFSPDGQIVLMGSTDGVSRLWDVDSGQALGQPMIQKDRIVGVSFSSNRREIITASPNHLATWDISRTPRVQFGQPWSSTASSGSVDVMLSPDGKTALVLSGNEDGTMQLWDTAAQKPIGQPLPASDNYGPAYSPDGRTILTAATDGTARLWDTSRANPIGPPMKLDAAIRASAFTSDGKSLIIVTIDGKTHVRNIASGQAPCDPLSSALLCITHDGFNRQQQVVATRDGHRVLASPDGFTARLRAIPSGEPIGSEISVGSPLGAVAISDDDRSVAIGGDNGSARVWSTDTGEPVGQAINHPSAISALAFSPDGKLLLIGGNDGVARLWTLSTKRPIGEPMIHKGAISDVWFTHDCQTVWIRSRAGLRLWDTVTGNPLGPAVELPGILHARPQPNEQTVLGSAGSWWWRWKVPRGVAGDAAEIARGVHSLTGLALDAGGGAHLLEKADWVVARGEFSRSRSRGIDDGSPASDEDWHRLQLAARDEPNRQTLAPEPIDRSKAFGCRQTRARSRPDPSSAWATGYAPLRTIVGPSSLELLVPFSHRWVIWSKDKRTGTELLRPTPWPSSATKERPHFTGLAKRLDERGKWEEAITAFKKAVALGLKSAIFTNRGYYHLYQKRAPERAIAYFSLAIENREGSEASDGFAHPTSN